MRDETTEIGAGDYAAGTQPGTAEKGSASEKEKVATTKKTTKKYGRGMNPRSLANLDPCTKENAADRGRNGGTMKAKNLKAISEGIELIGRCGVVDKIFNDFCQNKPKMVLAGIALLKHFGASFDQSDEASPQKVELDNRHSGGIDVHVTGLDI